MALGAWKVIPVSSASRAVACVHDGIHYSCPAASGYVTSIFRIDTATDVALPNLAVVPQLGLERPRSFVPFGSKIYVGTFQRGIYSIDPLTGASTVEVPFNLADNWIAHVVHGGKIHWFGTDGRHMEFDPANPSVPAYGAMPAGNWVSAQVEGNRAIVVADNSATALVVDF